MRLSQPRVEPLEPEAMDPEIRAPFGDAPILKIFRTLAHHPKLLKRWLVFGNHVLAKSSLAPRERELVILRTGYRCRAGYEWGQHVPIAKASGLTDAEIERIPRGPDAEGWSDLDRALLRASDELHEEQFVSDATYAELARHYDARQLMDLVFAVGQYHLVSMALNTFGVQLEAGAEGLPTP